MRKQRADKGNVVHARWKWGEVLELEGSMLCGTGPLLYARWSVF
jgi:hypothetical protein